MTTALRTAETEAEIWTGILYPDADIPHIAASAILRLSFSPTHRRRMRELSAKARAGELSRYEEFEMQNFERVGDMLSILKSKARHALKSNGRKPRP